ncbi:MAG: hypothetical protein H6577_21105 [Lewinellaceae bacterium]|nr:hypothetical protein [Saprospiraceae bacterium]MCB9340629.1 hypothetical protein [Lewinellaceae bacterium]
MRQSLFEEEAGFIQNLKTATGKALPEWFALIKGSGEKGFLDIRRWLVETQKLATSPATTIAQLYLEDQERKAPKVWFSQGGRGGDFSYESGEGGFTSWWEFGGGDTLAILSVPVQEHWEAQTGIPLAKRAEVLEFIGRETVRQQTTGGRGTFEVQEGIILIRVQ